MRLVLRVEGNWIVIFLVVCDGFINEPRKVSC